MLSGSWVGWFEGQAGRLHRFLVDGGFGVEGGFGVGDVGVSLAGRGVFEDRAVILGADAECLLGGVGVRFRLVRARPMWFRASRVSMGLLAVSRFCLPVRVLKGSVWVMGAHRRFGVFRDAFDEVCGLLDEHLGCSLRDVVFGAEHVERGLLDETLFTQTGLFALEVSLFRLLSEFWRQTTI